MDYGYVNARVRGMKSRLLTRHTLEEMAFRPDLDAVIADLEKTPYRDEIAESKARLSGILCIEDALRTNFARTFRRIRKIVEGSEAETFISIFLHRWDVQNIKTIIRGKNVHVTNEEILECLVPAGELDEATLSELLKQPDVKAVIDMLATWGIAYSVPLTEKFPQFHEKGDLSVLESALDRFYYQDALAVVGKRSYNDTLIRDILRFEIDIVNIKTILRMVRDHVDPEEVSGFLIEGGKDLDMKELSRLSGMPSTEEVLAGLVSGKFGFLAPVSELAVKSHKISIVEKQLERVLVRKGVDSFRGDPLSVAYIIGFFWAKYNEVTNIRIISRCKTTDIPDDQVREELVYV